MSVELRSFVVGSVVAVVLLAIAYFVFASDDNGTDGSGVAAPRATAVFGQALVTRSPTSTSSGGGTSPTVGPPSRTATPEVATPALTLSLIHI